MQSIEITINGVSYPCRMTMGAMLRFKRLSGREVTEVGDNLSDLATLLYCCCASACNADKVAFPYSLDDFCDNIGDEDMAALSSVFDAPQGGDGEQKKSL